MAADAPLTALTTTTLAALIKHLSDWPAVAADLRRDPKAIDGGIFDGMHPVDLVLLAHDLDEFADAHPEIADSEFHQIEAAAELVLEVASSDYAARSSGRSA